MKMLKRITIWLVVLIALLLIMAYLLPRHYMVQRDNLINADAGAVFTMVCDFNNWNHWTPWTTEEDSSATEEVFGRCEVGAVYRWDGEEVGNGEMKIIELAQDGFIKWELGFEDNAYKMNMHMTFEKEGDGVVVTWTAEGDLGYNPLFRYYGLMIDSDMGGDLEKGLQQLKEFCEMLPNYPGIQIAEIQSFPAISVKDSVTVMEIEPFMATYYPMLFLYAARMQVEMAGHPYAVYYNWDPDGKILVEAGLPLVQAIEGEDMMMSTMSPGGKVVKTSFFGSYDKVGPAHDAIAKYIEVMGLEYAGAPWEIYVTDPSIEPDTAKWETVICYPVR
ncbi:MAG TPA: SRPBCC family protein [Bacteroidales bacterium]|nr:SRPBCC family protein [Bacteroidales bacterium]